MLRRWAHNSTYTDVANPHNRIDDVYLATGILVVVDSIVERYMTEARCNSRSWWTTRCPLGYRFGLWLVMFVSLILVKPFLLCIYIEERLKQIDVI